MKSFVKTALAAIITEILDVKRESKLFSIKCLKCGCISELEYGFLKRSGDIAVDNAGENAVVNAGENIVSIQCNKCGNEIFSSEY